ncbi:MAG TPA: RimK family alpha-L-glutamate ligase, partial [Janthinobacterium sp.]|nr:RimK family alpha-L-glutamate ligase [Janthinobacterium sp.]
SSPTPYAGMPALMRLMASGIEQARLVDFTAFNMKDANLLMRLATVFNICGDVAMALEVQQRALKIKQLYHLPAPRLPAHGQAELRLLAILKPGFMKDNTPVEFLLEDSSVALDILYVAPDLPPPTSLPEHDVAFVAIANTEANQALLEQVRLLMAASARPVLNLPAPACHLERDRVSALLADAPGLDIPVSRHIGREQLLRIAGGEGSMAACLEDGDFPVIARPFGSQAGLGLVKLASPADIPAYLGTRPENVFCISRFVDYRSPDGAYRKCRIALIDGRPLVCHFAISPHWMVHYQSAGMAENAEKRQEEADFMMRAEVDFCRRHQQALAAVAERLGYDYVVIDCAETAEGKLLFFEADNIAIVHAMDDAALFPYKRVQMDKVFLAFRQMLGAAAQQPARRRPGG